MTNPYYNHTDGVPVYLARGTSSTIEAEFDLIATGFTGVDTAISAVSAASIAGLALKGNIAGQVWTGAHDYSGATSVLVPTRTYGTSGQYAVNMDTLNAAAFAAVLPSQTGNSGKFLTTNGTTANWALVFPTQTGNADYLSTTDGGTPGTVSWTPNLKATVIRFKDGTDASKLLAFDLTGLTTATTRTVTVPNKSGTMAMLSDVGLTLLAVLTPTAAATVDFLSTFSSTYDSYLIVGTGLVPNVSDTLQLRLATGGAADAGSNYASNGHETATYTTTATGVAVSTTVLAGGKGMSFAIYIRNTNDATNLKTIDAQGMGQVDAVPTWGNSGKAGVYFAANTVSGIRLYWLNGNNFTATGKIRVYGFQNS